MDAPRGSRVVYVQKESTNGNSAKIIAWVAGIGAMLITASICFAASALWSLSDRLARLETKFEAIQAAQVRQ